MLMEGAHRRHYAPHGIDTIAMEQSEEEIGTYAYQSCTDELSQVFEGYLTFVPGSLCNPTGEPFEVRVAPFQLCSDPNYYY